MEKKQLLRLIFIDRAIREGMQTGRLANCSTLARDYEVSTKSILRDIDYLRNQRDAPIAYDPKRLGYYYTEESYTLPALDISESDLFAICIAEKALRQYENTPVHQKLARVFAKIASVLPDRVTLDPATLDNRFKVIGAFPTSIRPEIWETVAAALRLSRTLSLSYRKPGAPEASQRRVDPCQIVSFQGEWYLLGYCHLREKVITFALSRIQEASMEQTTFSLPADFDFEKAGGDGFGIFTGSGRFTVVIEFDARHAPYVQERTWHRDQELHPLPHGGVRLSFPASHLYEVRRWALSWGSGTKVLQPPELIKEVQQELSAMAAAYNKTGAADKTGRKASA